MLHSAHINGAKTLTYFFSRGNSGANQVDELHEYAGSLRQSRGQAFAAAVADLMLLQGPILSELDPPLCSTDDGAQ